MRDLHPLGGGFQEFDEMFRVFSGDGTDVDRCLAMIWHDVGLRSPTDGAYAEGGAPEQGMLTGCDFRNDTLPNPFDGRGHFVDRIVTQLGSRGMDGFAVRRHGHPERSLVGMDRLEVGRLSRNHEVKALLGGQCLGAMLA